MEDKKEAFVDARFYPEVFMDKILGLDVQEFHKDWINTIQSNERVAIAAPRGHGKTTVFGVVYSLWIATYKKNKLILIVSNSLEQAKPILKEIKRRMQDNKILSDLIPKNQGTWTKREIDTATGCTIKIRPNTENIRGAQADYTICDEVSQFEDKDSFYGAVVPTVNAKDGKLVAIGTPMSDQDLLAELQRKDHYAAETYSAILNEGTDNEEPLWEDKYSLEKLRQIEAEIGSLKFQREYLCEKIPVQTQLISREKLKDCYRPNDRFVAAGEEDKTYFVGGDLAISGEQGADYTVFTTVEQTSKDGAFIKDIKRFKGAHIDNQKRILRQLVNNFNPNKINLDKSTFGEAMVQQMRNEGLPVFGVSFDANSRLSMLNRLVTFVENEKLKIPRDKDDGRTIQMTDILVDELTSLGTGITSGGRLTYKSYGRHPDVSMSLALAIRDLGGYKHSDVGIVTDEKIEEEGEEKDAEFDMFVTE